MNDDECAIRIYILIDIDDYYCYIVSECNIQNECMYYGMDIILQF